MNHDNVARIRRKIMDALPGLLEQDDEVEEVVLAFCRVFATMVATMPDNSPVYNFNWVIKHFTEAAKYVNKGLGKDVNLKIMGVHEGGKI